MGWQVSPNTVAALMREQGLVARRKHRWHGGLVGVFLGVAGLIMGVTSIIKIGVAVVVAAIFTAFVAILIRDRSS